MPGKSLIPQHRDEVVREAGHAHGVLQCRTRGCGITWARDRVGSHNIARLVAAAASGGPRPVALSHWPARPTVADLQRRW